MAKEKSFRNILENYKNRTMKYLSLLLLTVLLITACQPETKEPMDLTGKQALLKEKQKELR